MIRFTSPAAASVSMFEKDAKTFIRLMGHSGTIPSAIRAEDVATALQHLEAALKAEAAQTEAPNKTAVDDAEDKAVSPNVRAYPLLQLLKAAIAKQKNVMWEQDSAFF
ncbi:MAG: hypothetical protein RL122_1804 [Pseudomonadota bacterium]|uniref:DUF1840 domain-containing protein n=1 Tax=Thiothrix fructosivorans TaxID=111770 RepID=A0A8B0SP10_9GAMM|nr:DUF1840 domain-containing protein [Thiothrix fructosivorans]MBO0614182.1 DUF1840 domain-containing protein [Thiothrix fructosivorans]QTX12664.1 DUF1840 domain-containing protein [Thiothrix fructosivorans]